MITLTEEQRQQLSRETPPRVQGPVTQETYVLLKADLYDRVRGLVEDDDSLDLRQVAILIEEAMREDDANDPLLESYQHYRSPQ